MIRFYIVHYLSIVESSNDLVLLGSFSLVKSFTTKKIIINKGVKNAEAETTPIILLKFSNGFFINGSPHWPQINTPSHLVLAN